MSFSNSILVVLSYTIFQYIYYYVDKRINFSSYLSKVINTKFKKIIVWILIVFIITVISTILNNIFRINEWINIILTISLISLINYSLLIKNN